MLGLNPVMTFPSVYPVALLLFLAFLNKVYILNRECTKPWQHPQSDAADAKYVLFISYVRHSLVPGFALYLIWVIMPPLDLYTLQLSIF